MRWMASHSSIHIFMINTSQCASVWLGVAFSMRQFDWPIIAFGAGAFITVAALVIVVTWS